MTALEGNLRTALLVSANRHRTVLLASGAVLAALLVFVTAPHGAGGRGSRQGSISYPSSGTGTALSGNVTGGGQPASFDQALKEGARLRASLISTKEPASTPSGIAAHLAEGQRAFAMRVAEDDIVGGFLQSGDRVDILATIPGSAFPQKESLNAPDRSDALLLLQDIPVLAVGANLNNTGALQADAHTVSLSLTPDQLVRLTLALRLGKVSLAIRRPGDNSISTVTGATLSDILPALRPVEPVPKPTHAPVVSPVPGHQVPFYAGTHAATITWGGRP